MSKQIVREAPRYRGTRRVSVLVDPDLSVPELRQSVYDGNVVVLTTLRSVGSFVDYIREQLLDLFAPYEPEYTHEHIDTTEMAKLLDGWKPRFMHSPRSKEVVRAIIREAGFPTGETHYDVPKPRTSFPAGHLTTGIAYAFDWHRDTWYSAPAQQINWWLPVYPVRADNAMCFDLQAFSRAVANSSGGFDYYQNNRARLTTASQVTAEEQSATGSPGPRATRRARASPTCRHRVAVLRVTAPRLHPQHLGESSIQCRLPDGRRDGPPIRARRSVGRRQLHGHCHPGLPPGL